MALTVSTKNAWQPADTGVPEPAEQSWDLGYFLAYTCPHSGEETEVLKERNPER